MGMCAAPAHRLICMCCNRNLLVPTACYLSLSLSQLIHYGVRYSQQQQEQQLTRSCIGQFTEEPVQVPQQKGEHYLRRGYQGSQPSLDAIEQQAAGREFVQSRRLID